jgi:hypothetical protein
MDSFKSKKIIMYKRMTLSKERLMIEFPACKTGKFLIRWFIFGTFVTVFVFNSKEMNRKSFSLAYLCKMLLFTHAPVVISRG